MKYKIPRKNYGLNECFEAIAKVMGHTITSETQFDCRNVNVAANIQDGFYQHYTDLILSKDETETVDSARVDVTMLLAIYGPKVDGTLADDEVEVFDGFLC